MKLSNHSKEGKTRQEMGHADLRFKLVESFYSLLDIARVDGLLYLPSGPQ